MIDELSGELTDDLMLGADEVHVFRAVLDQPEPVVERLRCVLDEAEVRRAARFCFARDHDHFIVARGILRTLLARYLGASPAALSFGYGAQGKPWLISESGAPSAVRFNVSHSHGAALFAFALNREVGVDVELVRPDFAEAAIAEKFFSPREVAALRSLPKEQQAAGFFNCWTRKEAWIKARAHGLSFPLDRFSVTLRPGEAARLLEISGEEGEAERWSLAHLELGERYVGALAVAGNKLQLRVFTLACATFRNPA